MDKKINFKIRRFNSFCFNLIKLDRMRKNIEIYQLVISVLFVLGGIAGVWMNINSRLTIVETIQQNDANTTTEMKSTLKEISETQTKILIELQNKKNK